MDGGAEAGGWEGEALVRAEDGDLVLEITLNQTPALSGPWSHR